MSVPAIIVGDVNSVLRLAPSRMIKPERWGQFDSDLLAHFVQVHQQIQKSRWSNSELSISGNGKTISEVQLPSFEDFVFVAVYFRQLTMQKDDLLNEAVEKFCEYTDCPARRAWIREEQKDFNSHLDSDCVLLSGYTLREMFDAFMYGAALMHKSPKLNSQHRAKFLKLFDEEPRNKVLFALNGSMRTLLNPVGGAAALIYREFASWMHAYSLPLPDVRWHDRLFYTEP